MGGKATTDAEMLWDVRVSIQVYNTAGRIPPFVFHKDTVPIRKDTYPPWWQGYNTLAPAGPRKEGTQYYPRGPPRRHADYHKLRSGQRWPVASWILGRDHQLITSSSYAHIETTSSTSAPLRSIDHVDQLTGKKSAARHQQPSLKQWTREPVDNLMEPSWPVNSLQKRPRGNSVFFLVGLWLHSSTYDQLRKGSSGWVLSNMMSQCHFLMHACPATPTFTDTFITIRVQVSMVRLMLVMILALASSRDLHRNGQQVIVVSSYNSFFGQFLVVD